MTADPVEPLTLTLTPAEAAAVRQALQFREDPTAQRVFARIPCPHSYAVQERFCDTCGEARFA